MQVDVATCDRPSLETMLDKIELQLRALSLDVRRGRSGSVELIHAANEAGSVEVSLMGQDKLWVEYWAESIPDEDDPPTEEIAADDLENLIFKIKSWLKC